ncbi:hypothetical protein CDD80_5740 [Ophiocordyceps camponoti-rufipedis]|uniref:Uncharacterized protein n=1 Tax=Ophiocordyceps camponoti-rufipedis TaxID=2004952 RepID=A0A2C5ZG85_9HYPO|nr:hypothetical protein CDD80_5740 [Ophiocordyceps camponoti-rufipedis]
MVHLASPLRTLASLLRRNATLIITTSSRPSASSSSSSSPSHAPYPLFLSVDHILISRPPVDTVIHGHGVASRGHGGAGLCFPIRHAQATSPIGSLPTLRKDGEQPICLGPLQPSVPIRPFSPFFSSSGRRQMTKRRSFAYLVRESLFRSSGALEQRPRWSSAPTSYPAQPDESEWKAEEA